MRSRRWQVLLPLGVATILSLAGDLTLYAVLPAQAPALGLSLAAVGILLSANRLTRLASNPAVGLLTDSHGRRRLFLGGMALGSLSTLTYVLFRQVFLIFLLGRAMWGVSWSLIAIAGNCMVVDITDTADRGRTMGILQGFSAFGHSVCPLLGGILTGYLGFQAALSICAGMTALGYLIALLALPETRPATLPSRCAGPGRRQAARARGTLAWLRAPGRGFGPGHRQFLGASYMTLLHAFAGYGILMSTVSLYLQRRHGDVVSIGRLSWPVATVGGGLLALWALLSAAVALPAGHLSDRSGSRWTVIACGSLSGAAGMAALAFGNTPHLTIAGVALVALGGGVVNAVLPAVVGDLAPPERRGLLQGGLMTMEAIGSAAAPLMAYALVAVLPLEAAYLVSAAGLATGLALPWVCAGEGRLTGRAVDEPA